MYRGSIIFSFSAQNLLAGPDRGISTSRISLEIVSSDVPDLTLIDLPGITRLVVRGQDGDASQKVSQQSVM